MVNEKYFEELLISIKDYKKLILLIFLIQNDKNFLREIGFSENHIDRLNNIFKDILLKEYNKFLSFIKNEEESIIESILIN